MGGKKEGHFFSKQEEISNWLRLCDWNPSAVMEKADKTQLYGRENITVNN